MKQSSILVATLSPLIFAASCGGASPGDSAQSTPAPGYSLAVDSYDDLAIDSYGSFDEPWAAAFAPGTSVVFVTEKAGRMKFVDTPTGRLGTVTGLPRVDYGGQGGLGDVAFLESEAAPTLDRRTIYLSWVEAGSGGTRGAVVGRGTLVCEEADACRIDGLQVIWRQAPKVDGRGHYSHRIAISPDEKFLFVSSGERQEMQPAQDTSNNLGSVVRLTLDGKPAPGNPFFGQAGKAQDVWSYGHRNVLGLQFDASDQLWGLEHGPRGGDELNRIERGANYGWPRVSDGDHYGGSPIPRHASTNAYAKPAISWNPVIAPGDFTFYYGDTFLDWKGFAVIAAMKPAGLVLVDVEADTAREVLRIPFDKRLREVVQGPDDALWVLEDKAGGRLLRLTPRTD